MQSEGVATGPENYLEQELRSRIQDDPRLIAFLEEGCLDGLWFWDLERPEHEWMSERFWRTLGVEPSEKAHLASEWQDLIHPDDLELATQNVERHLEDAAHPYDQVVRYRHADGSWVWIRCRGLAIRDADGTPVRMLGAHTNLTQEREAQAKWQSMHSFMVDLSQTLAHDLQQPLRNISTFAEMVGSALDEGDTEKIQRWLEFIQKASDDARSRFDGLLSLLQTDLAEIQLEPVDAHEVAAEILARLHLDLERAGAVVSIPSPLPHVWADRSILQSIFQNLIENSIKYRSDQRDLAIVIECESIDTHQLSFRVVDNGSGFEPQLADHVFDLYGRLQPETAEGKGIGLTMARRLARRLGGDITALGNPDKGTEMTVTLPSLPGAAS